MSLATSKPFMSCIAVYPGCFANENNVLMCGVSTQQLVMRETCQDHSQTFTHALRVCLAICR